MVFNKKIRFFIIAYESLKTVCEQKKINALDYKIITDEFGLILELYSKEEENIKEFILSLPKDIMFFHSSLIDLSISDMAAEALKKNSLKLVVVESCTGGLISKIITDKPGSSDYFWGGYITYDNKAKESLGIPASTIERYGAVSGETVISMAEKGLEKSGAGICVSVSGIAGPGGSVNNKPVGTVWIAVKKEIVKTFLFLFSGSRKDIRDKASQAALLIVYKELLNCGGVDSTIFEHYI